MSDHNQKAGAPDQPQPAVEFEDRSSLWFRFYKHPKKKIKKAIKGIGKKPKFKGWGMQTFHEVAWRGGDEFEVFLRANQDVRSFDFGNHAYFYTQNMDQLMWRHWNISFAVRYAFELGSVSEANFVECGVAYGVSAFFALREAQARHTQGLLDDYSMHLYDAWVPTKKYGDISADTVRRNLAEFDSRIFIHAGYIPETLTSEPIPHENIAYLHIDLNSAAATQDALDFFFPKLADRSVILFDDYGHANYHETKTVADAFFKGRKGILMPLPTGQAIYFP